MTDHPDRATEAAAERVEEVDETGAVLRVVTRAAMRAGRLRHRCTYIVVLDADDRVVVHQRAAWKDLWPGRWDLAFGGVAGVGEDWAEAAARELAEEAGVEASLEPLGDDPVVYADDDVALVGRAYLARHDGPFTFPDGEVAATERVPLAEVVAWVSSRPHCPDSVVLVADALADLARRPG